jgi:tagatose 1,6-diphosphate aldolase
VIGMTEQISIIQKKLEEISSEIEFLYFNASWMIGENICFDFRQEEERRKKQAELRKEYFELNRQLDILYKVDFAMKNKPAMSNGILDVYVGERNVFTKAFQYNLFKHGTYEYVGNIKYSGKNDSIFGNISYEIEEKYRGNHFALIGLQIISEDLYERNVKEVFISAEKKNIASIKTIERFGGTIIDDDCGIKQYRCDLSLILNKTRNKR